MAAILENTDSGTIRIDTATKKGSIIDVIRMVLGCDSGNANNALRRLKDDCTELTAGCSQLRINGKGKLTPVASANTLVEIVFLLPGKNARDFRRKSAVNVCRLLGGDTTLVTEIEQRCAVLESTAEGRITKEFLQNGGSSAGDAAVAIDSSAGDAAVPMECLQCMPEGFAFLSTIDRQIFAKDMVHQALKRRRHDDMVQRYASLRELGIELDPRTKLEIKDNVSILARRDLVTAGPATANPAICAAQDLQTPTHDLAPEQRGHETGIVAVSSKISVRVPSNMSGTIGKLIKRLYKKKYDLPDNWDAFVKRQTLFRGRPVMENCYYERDEDIIEKAIRSKISAD